MEISKKIGLIPFLLIVLSAGCQKETGKLAQYSEYDCLENETKEYFLCTKKSDAVKNGVGRIDYVVADVNGKELKSGSIGSGWVAWLDAKAIEIYRTPGVIPIDATDDMFTKVFVVESREMIPKIQYLSDKN